MSFTITDTGVAGDTKILTDQGYLPISSLVDTTIPCWNGIEWSLTTIFKTSDNQKIATVTTYVGKQLQVGLGHKLSISKICSNPYTIRDVEITIDEFRIDDSISAYSVPVVISKVDANIKEFHNLLHSTVYWGNPNHNGLQLYIKNKQEALYIIMLLQELGIPVTSIDSSLGYHLSRDKELQAKYGFVSHSVYIIPIRTKYVDHLKYLGLQIDLPNQKDSHVSIGDGIRSIQKQDYNIATYSGIEPKRNRLMCNGLLIGDSSPINK